MTTTDHRWWRHFGGTPARRAVGAAVTVVVIVVTVPVVAVWAMVAVLVAAALSAV